MSYAFSNALQTAIYQRLRSDAGVAALVGEAIYDALPTGDVPTTYIALGPELVKDRSDSGGAGAEHRFDVSVVTDQAGFGAAKTVAAAVENALTTTDLTLAQGRLVGLWFLRATAKRTGKAGRARRIDLRFRARVESN